MVHIAATMDDDPQRRLDALEQLVSAWQERALAEERLTAAVAEARKLDISPNEASNRILEKTAMSDPEEGFAIR